MNERWLRIEAPCTSFAGSITFEACKFRSVGASHSSASKSSMVQIPRKSAPAAIFPRPRPADPIRIEGRIEMRDIHRAIVEGLHDTKAIPDPDPAARRIGTHLSDTPFIRHASPIADSPIRHFTHWTSHIAASGDRPRKGAPVDELQLPAHRHSLGDTGGPDTPLAHHLRQIMRGRLALDSR